MKKLITAALIITAFIGLGMAGLQLGSAGQLLTMAANGQYYAWADPVPAILFSTGAPLSTSGVNGNVDIDNSTWNTYYKTGGAWVLKGNIKGATGAQGIAGVAGPVGAQGVAGAVGTQGLQGLQGLQGIQGPIGPTGPAGSSGTSALPTTGNNFDQLTWYNGNYILLPANPIFQVDYRGLTAGTTLGYTYIDPTGTNYNPAGVIKIYNITAGSSVALNFLYTDNNGVIVTYNYPVSTTGPTVLPLNKIINVTPGGSIQVFTTVTGTATYDVRATINIAP